MFLLCNYVEKRFLHNFAINFIIYSYDFRINKGQLTKFNAKTILHILLVFNILWLNAVTKIHTLLTEH